jgi:hypothetical protein
LKTTYIVVYWRRVLGRSKLVADFKDIIEGRYILEIRLYQVDDDRYRERIKYSLIMVEPTQNKFVLMDNHHPKGPHYHLDENEFRYVFKNKEQLFKDFRLLVFTHFGVKI